MVFKGGSSSGDRRNYLDPRPVDRTVDGGLNGLTPQPSRCDFNPDSSDSLTVFPSYVNFSQERTCRSVLSVESWT